MSKKKSATEQPPVVSPRKASQAEAMTRYEVEIDEMADADLRGISDEETRAVIIRKIAGLAEAPLKQGKALKPPLKHYRSVRAAGQRYRIVYQVAVTAGKVIVVVVGIRKAGSKKDVYVVATKRLA